MTSNSEWGEKTSGMEVASVFAEQIRGKNVLITGVGPHGIGQSTAIAIASQNPSALILASRTQEKLEAVAAQIKKSYPDVDTKTVILDLASQESVRNAAAEVTALIPKLDVLINNAGVSTGSRKWTKEKTEMQFGTNHIGHFLFTKLLLPLLEAAARGSRAGETRIINISSQGHRLSPIRFHDYNIEGKEVPPEEAPSSSMPPAFAKTLPDGYMPIVAYGQSKTANILFSVYLQDHIKSHGITSFAVHPGGIKTDLGRENDPDVAEAITKTAIYWKTLDEGASTTLVAAFDPALNESTEVYLSDCQLYEPVAYAKDPVAADRLWKLSENLIGEEFMLA